MIIVAFTCHSRTLVPGKEGNYASPLPVWVDRERRERIIFLARAIVGFSMRAPLFLDSPPRPSISADFSLLSRATVLFH
jgi:hypothetical protein